MQPRALLAGLALVLGAALGVVLLAPEAEDAPQGPVPTPRATEEARAPAPGLVTLHDIQLPSRRGPGQLDDHNLALVQEGDRDLRVVADYGDTGADPGLTWPFVVLRDPLGREVQRCERADCDWTIAEPMPGRWIVAVAPEGSWPLRVTVTLARASPVSPEAELANQTRVASTLPRPTGWLEAFAVERPDVPLELRLASSPGSCGASVNVIAPRGQDTGVVVPQTIAYEPVVGRWQVGVSPGTCSSVSVVMAPRNP